MEGLSCDLAKELTAPMLSVVLAAAPRRARRPEPTPQLACRMIRPNMWYRIGWDGAGGAGRGLPQGQSPAREAPDLAPRSGAA
jgi:hypothetical protein